MGLLPMDIVNYILSFDSRFVIERGVAVYKPFKVRYQHIIELLQNKTYLRRVWTDIYVANFKHKTLTLYVWLDRYDTVYYDLRYPDLSLCLYSN